jgi:hypothetical protein
MEDEKRVTIEFETREKAEDFRAAIEQGPIAWRDFSFPDWADWRSCSGYVEFVDPGDLVQEAREEGFQAAQDREKSC